MLKSLDWRDKTSYSQRRDSNPISLDQTQKWKYFTDSRNFVTDYDDFNCSQPSKSRSEPFSLRHALITYDCLQAIVAMEFDSNGSLLLTCDRLGNYFNLFKIVPHPAGSCYAAVHHLYSLFRGDTPGSVQVCFICWCARLSSEQWKVHSAINSWSIFWKLTLRYVFS